MTKILIIDDDAQVRTFINKLLTKENFEVYDAENGKIGFEMYRRCPTDVVIVDIFMPEKEGIETIRELKSAFPDIKIIAMSGGGNKMGPDTWLTLARALGAAATLEKPFTRAAMLDAIANVL